MILHRLGQYEHTIKIIYITTLCLMDHRGRNGFITMSLVVGYLTVANMFCQTLLVNKSGLEINKNDLVMAKKAIIKCEEENTNNCLTQFVKYDNINYEYNCEQRELKYDSRKFRNR